jgi:uncharacterized protein YdaU (DUF1376 family)
MSWHIGDYLKDTGGLRAAEHGAYFLLCMHYWATGGLPDDDRQLAGIARMTDKEWRAARPIIEPLFKGEGKWKHKRVEEELADAQAKYEKLAAAGSKGGNARAMNKRRCSDATSDALAIGYQPITDKEKKDAEPSGSHPKNDEAELFERGKKVLGKDAGGLIAKLLKSKKEVPLARAAIEMAATKQNPREYIGRVLAGPATPERPLSPFGTKYPDGII